MAQNNFVIEIKIWDTWMVDSYSSKGYLVYFLIEIGNKLQLINKYLDEF